MVFRYVLSLVVGAVLLATPAAARAPYHDATWKFRVEVPSGWEAAPALNAENPRVHFAGPNRAACNVAAADYSGMTGVQLEQAYVQSLDPAVFFREIVAPMRSSDTWLRGVKVSGYKAALGETTVTMADGRLMRLRKLIVPVPGRVYNVNCATTLEAFPAMRFGFESLTDSFRVD